MSFRSECATMDISSCPWAPSSTYLGADKLVLAPISTTYDLWVTTLITTQLSAYKPQTTSTTNIKVKKEVKWEPATALIVDSVYYSFV